MGEEAQGGAVLTGIVSFFGSLLGSFPFFLSLFLSSLSVTATYSFIIPFGNMYVRVTTRLLNDIEQ
jgi:hypothetical protein